MTGRTRIPIKNNQTVSGLLKVNVNHIKNIISNIKIVIITFMKVPSKKMKSFMKKYIPL